MCGGRGQAGEAHCAGAAARLRLPGRSGPALADKSRHRAPPPPGPPPSPSRQLKKSPRRGGRFLSRRPRSGHRRPFLEAKSRGKAQRWQPEKLATLRRTPGPRQLPAAAAAAVPRWPFSPCATGTAGGRRHSLPGSTCGVSSKNRRASPRPSRRRCALPSARASLLVTSPCGRNWVSSPAYLAPASFSGDCSARLGAVAAALQVPTTRALSVSIGGSEDSSRWRSGQTK